MATREEEIKVTAQKAMEIWEYSIAELEKKKNVFKRTSGKIGKFLTVGGKSARQAESNKRRQRLQGNLSNPFYKGVIMSTDTRLDLVSAGDIWPGVDQIKALQGVTVVCEAEGRVELFYGGHQATVYVSEDLKSAGLEEAKFDERFGIKKDLNANPLFEGMDEERKKRVAATAKAGAIIWAMVLASAKENKTGMSDDARKGLMKWQKPSRPMEEELVQVLREIGETGSVVYSSNPDLDDLVDDKAVDDVRDAMTAGTISMQVQEGKVTIFDGEEKTAYTFDEGVILFNDADGNLLQTAGNIRIPDKLFKRMIEAGATSGKSEFGELYEIAES